MVARHLLFIDDNEDSRTLVKFALESQADWKVSTACDGVKGIVKAETERPDVILLDFMMPNLDGLVILDILKSNLFTCSIPVILFTAMVQADLLFQLENTQAIGVITKPFDIINLNSQIAEICRWNKVKDRKLIRPATVDYNFE